MTQFNMPQANFTTVASPVDTAVNFGNAGAPQQADVIIKSNNEFNQIAQGFQELSSSLRQLGQGMMIRDEKETQDAFDRMKASNMALAKAQEAGLLNPEENPNIYRGRAMALGQKHAKDTYNKWMSKIDERRLNSEDMQTFDGGMEAFNKFAADGQNSLPANMERDDILRVAYGLSIAKYRGQFEENQSRYVGKVSLEASISGYKAAVGDALLSGDMNEVSRLIANEGTGPTETGPYPFTQNAAKAFAVEVIIDALRKDRQNGSKIKELVAEIKTGPSDGNGKLVNESIYKNAYREHVDEILRNLDMANRGGMTVNQYLGSVRTGIQQGAVGFISEQLGSNPALNIDSSMNSYMSSLEEDGRYSVSRRRNMDGTVWTLTSTEDESVSVKIDQDRIVSESRRMNFDSIVRETYESGRVAQSPYGIGRAIQNAIEITGSVPDDVRDQLRSGVSFSVDAYNNALAQGDEQAKEYLATMKAKFETSLGVYDGLDRRSKESLNLSPIDQTRFEVATHLYERGQSFDSIARGIQKFTPERKEEVLKEWNSLDIDETEYTPAQLNLIRDHTLMLYALSSDAETMESAFERTEAFIDKNYSKVSGVPVRNSEIGSFSVEEVQAIFGENVHEGRIIQAINSGSLPDAMRMYFQENPSFEQSKTNAALRFEHVQGDTFVLVDGTFNTPFATISMTEFIDADLERILKVVQRTDDGEEFSFSEENKAYMEVFDNNPNFFEQVAGSVNIGIDFVKSLFKSESQMNSLTDYANYLKDQDDSAVEGPLSLSPYLAEAARQRAAITRRLYIKNLKNADNEDFADDLIKEVNRTIDDLMKPEQQTSTAESTVIRNATGLDAGERAKLGGLLNND